MKIIYAGSSDASKEVLKTLIESQSIGYEIVGVLSNHPTIKGRDKQPTPTPVAEYALEKGIPVFTPEHLDASAREQIEPLKAELLVSFAYGHIFGPKFLAMFSMGGINLHPSLLPKYRGCTPVNAAIANGDKQTAITIQRISLGIDEGNILAQRKIELDGTETCESLLKDVAEKGAGLLAYVLLHFKDIVDVEQLGEPSYTEMITKDSCRINWHEPARKIEAKIRAYYNPGCWTMYNENMLKIMSASVKEDESKYDNFERGTVVDFVRPDGIYIKTGDGILCVKELQRQGKKVMDYKSFMNGARDFIGTVLV